MLLEDARWVDPTTQGAFDLTVSRIAQKRTREAEVHRVLGDLERRQPAWDAQAAEKSFVKALEVARSQQAKGFELRSAIGFARLSTENRTKLAIFSLQSITDSPRASTPKT